MASGSDALYEACVGPSAYWKTQGTVVRVWGLLVAGLLFITVLPENETMTTARYEWIISHKFPLWLQAGLGRWRNVYLVQDHERCLWTDEAVEALEDEGITLLENFPKCSQDLNPIEVAWRELRARLAASEPTYMESRPVFMRRLHAAVAWVNRHRAGYLRHLCTSQKEWARDVVLQGGGRTKH